MQSTINHIKDLCKTNLNKINLIKDEVEIETDKANLISLLTFLKDDQSCLFEQLTDLTAIDYPNYGFRFLIVYQLLSVTNNQRIRVLCPLMEGETIQSVSNLYQSSIWAEREMWDMFGIFVEGHPDLRRLLTDYGFQGHPLRKDFPLTGHVEVGYDVDRKMVTYNEVELVQDYRDFDFSSPCGATNKNITDEENK